MDAARRLIREPDVSDPRHYRRRVAELAGIYVAIFALSAAGIALLLLHGRLFVTLSQRSNVETLTIAFFLLFFAYIALISARGAWGGLRIGAFRLAARLARDARSSPSPTTRAAPGRSASTASASSTMARIGRARTSCSRTSSAR